MNVITGKGMIGCIILVNSAMRKKRNHIWKIISKQSGTFPLLISQLKKKKRGATLPVNMFICSTIKENDQLNDIYINGIKYLAFKTT